MWTPWSVEYKKKRNKFLLNKNKSRREMLEKSQNLEKKPKEKLEKEELEAERQKRLNYLKKSSGMFSAFKDIKTTHEMIDDCRVESEINSALLKCFIELRKGDSDNNDKLEWDIWHLRSDISNAIIPFNSPSYNMDARFKEIKQKSDRYPSIREDIERIEPGIEKIFSDTYHNKKEEKILTYLSSMTNAKKYGLLLNHREGSYFKSDLIPEIRNKLSSISLFNNLHFFSNSRDIQNFLHNGELPVLDHLIVPSGGKYIYFLKDIFYSGFTRNVHFIFYDGEALNPFLKKPGALHLPKPKHGPYFTGNFSDEGMRIPNYKEPKSIFAEKDSVDYNEDWLNSDIPDSVVSVGNNNDIESIVDARYLLFTGNRKIFFEKTHKVYEISNFLSRKEDKLTNKEVGTLEPGDQILLGKTSADYIGKKTDMLLKENKTEYIKEHALIWKPCLENALSEKGAKYFLTKLNDSQRNNNLDKYTNADYLWIWTTENVLAPKKDLTFVALMGILMQEGNLQEILGDKNIEEFCEYTWRQIRTFKVWRRRAAHLILKELNLKFEGYRDSDDVIDDGFEVTIGDDETSIIVYKVMNLSQISYSIRRSDLGKIFHD